MKQNLLKKFIIYFPLFIFLIFTTSFKVPFAEPILQFKIMVIKRSVLQGLFDNGVNQIIFQHTSKRATQTAGKRHKYHLIAYYKGIDGLYTQVNTTFFVARTTEPKFVDITIAGDGATSNFGNMTLEKATIPNEDPKYKFIILYPEVFNEDAQGDGDPDYVHYKLYFAETKEDLPTEEKIKFRAIKPILVSLNPSPPR